jgi:hypothetical protein
MARFSRLTKIAVLLQVIGSATLLLGADRNMVLYLLGFILLLRGSAIAMLIPLHVLGTSWPLTPMGIDGSDLENLLYLPITIVGCSAGFDSNTLRHNWVRVPDQWEV